MPTYISFVNWTEQGVKNVKESPNRAEAARALIKAQGGEIKDIYMTTGEHDLLVICEAPDGESLAKALLTIAGQGNVRTHTVRGFTEQEFQKIVADLP